MRDLTTGTVLGVAMLVLLASARAIPDSPFEPMGARFLAQAVPGAILALSLVLAARGLASRGRAARRDPSPRAWRVVGIFALLFAYVFALGRAGGLGGYVAATTVFFVATGAVLERGLVLRRAAFAALVGVSIAAVIGYAFTEFLYVSLPG